MTDSHAAELAIYHEHPEWFRPLFRGLERRGVPFRRIRPGEEHFAVGRGDPPFRVLFNRMSPSAFLRGQERGIFFAHHYLEHLEGRGVRTVNGSRAFALETSKIRQLALLDRLGLPHPRTRVVRSPARAPEAARELPFPVVVKPNVGGSGAGIARFETPEELERAVADGSVEAGIDGALLVQEYVEPADGSIVRVEFLDGRILYAIRVYPEGDDFNLCPADACRTTGGEALGSEARPADGDRTTASESGACPSDAAERGLRVEGYEPPARIRRAMERIARETGLEVGGVEYVEDTRTGEARFYDINALSNFVADAPRVVGFDPWEPLLDYLERVVAEAAPRLRAGEAGRDRTGEPAGDREPARIRFGYWLPVFGGWLRNVEEEGMEASWPYVRRLARRSEELGFDLTLVAELFQNDIKAADAPSLDAWSTAAALAAVTERLELMVAVRPTYHPPGVFAKQAANIDRISGGRLALNLVASWWEEEARRLGAPFDRHDDRYARASEWLRVVSGLWERERFDFEGDYYRIEDGILEPKPLSRPRPTVYAGGESEAGKEMISGLCDAYVMHGDPPARVEAKIRGMKERRRSHGGPPMRFGVSGFVVVRGTEDAVQEEVARITAEPEDPAAYHSFQDWVDGTELERSLEARDYAVSNRGLHSGLVGTPEQVARRIDRFRRAGADLLLLQFSPQLEEMERFAEEVIPRVRELEQKQEQEEEKRTAVA